MKKLVNILFVILILVAAGYGQTNPTSNQYVFNPMSINPAFTGGRGALNISTFYGKRWVGVEGSPTTITFSADAPFAEKKIGLGLMVINDKIGVTKEDQFLTSYSYRLLLNNGTLSFGLGAGVVFTNTKYSDLIVIDPGDEIYLTNTRNYAVPTFSFGVHYSYKKYFVGLSVPKFLNYKFDFSKNKYVLNNDLSLYSYLLNTGYMFNAGQKLKIFPSMLFRYSKIPAPEQFQYDINLHMGFLDFFWLGGSYRNNRTVSAFLQIDLNDQFRIAYSYNFEISKIGRYSNGSHELMMRYEFRYNVDVLDPLVF